MSDYDGEKEANKTAGIVLILFITLAVVLSNEIFSFLGRIINIVQGW